MAEVSNINLNAAKKNEDDLDLDLEDEKNNPPPLQEAKVESPVTGQETDKTKEGAEGTGEKLEKNQEEEDQKVERKKYTGGKEAKRRFHLRAGLKPLYNLSESEEFSDEEILAHSKQWIEKYAGKPENYAEVLKYFELAKEIISSEFPPDRRVEVICALAEILAEGHMDAESLALLVAKIEPEKQDTANQNQNNDYEGVAFFREAKDESGAKIILTEKFFEQNEAGVRKYNLAHMLKHEVGHSLISYGEIISEEEMRAVNLQIKNPEAKEKTEIPKISAEVYRIINQANSEQHLQTYHVTKVLQRLEALKQQKDIAKSEIEKGMVMAANQIMAEKIGLYLSSNGEFTDFLRATIEVTSDENLQKIFATSEKPEIQAIIQTITTSEEEEKAAKFKELEASCPELAGFIESNKVFFDLANKRLKDKKKLKENIEKNLEGKGELSTGEEDFFGYYRHGFYEPGTPVQTNQSGQSKERRENFLETALKLAGAIGGEIESVTPISEITGTKAT